MDILLVCRFRLWLADWISDESKFLLRDEKSEKKLGFSLSESIEKAKLKKVFAGKKFFLTQQIVPPPKELEQVIRCGGGEVGGFEISGLMK